MIVHFAAFIFKQEFKAEEPQKEAREKITEALSKINVPALIVRFEDEDALKRYAVDPEHKKAQEVIKRYANLEDTLDYDLTINGEW
ncbi:stress responsive A/B barrel domain protein, partial [Rhizoctonia solani AG-3 Rhs1AP]